MSNTANLALPLIEAAQAQKHVTHNEALAIIDGLLQLAVKSRVMATPPVTPADGDRYLVAASPTGLWAGQAGKLAQYLAGLWSFRSPREGWRTWVDDENVLLMYDGATWSQAGVPNEFQNVVKLGVNTSADNTNRLSVSSSAVLFNHAGNGTQIKVNKNAAADTASVLFQTGFSGRAEFGTTGDDDFHVKVSADGATFNEALVLGANDGRTTVKKTLVLEPQAADPATPVNGQLWYNSTTGKFRARQNGSSSDVIGAGGGGAASWGTITGTISTQTDLQTVLNAKLNASTISTFGLTLVDDVDAAAARSTLGLGTAATSASTAFAAASHTHVLANVSDVTITVANLNALDDGVNTALHFHDADRSRTNHTGTQTSATISDFNTAADARANARIAVASVNDLADVAVTSPTAGQVLKWNGSAWVNDTDATSAGGGGTGDVVGPASATDGAIALYNGATGKTVKNSALVVSATGEITGAGSVTLPADPGNGNLVRATALIAGRTTEIVRSGLESWQECQGQLAQLAVALWQPPGNSTTAPAVVGMSAQTVLGTATTRSVATASKATRQRRLGYVSAATAAALAGHYSSTAQFTIGDGTGNGGFKYLCRFVPSDAASVAGARMFVGLRNNVAAPTNVEPNTLTQYVGVAQLSTSNNLQIVFGGSAAQTPIDLGTNFPANGLSADVYELRLWSPSLSANKLHYRVTRLNTGQFAEGQLGPGTAGVTIPNATTLLAHTAWRTNNATALAVALDICSVQIEQLDTN